MEEAKFFFGLGRFVAGPKTKWLTLIIWIIIAAVLSIVAPSVSKEENNNAALLPSTSASVQATNLVEKEFPSAKGTPALLVFYDKSGLSVKDFSNIQAIAKSLGDHKVNGELSVVPLNQVPSYVLPTLASKDKTTIVLPVTFSSSIASSDLQNSLTAMQKQIDTAIGFNPFKATLSTSGLHARVSGPAGIAVDALGLFKGADLALLIATTFLVLILLIILYRSPILAIIPLIGVGVAYSVISAILGLLAKSGAIVVDAQGVSIMTVLLFGAGTDYCLFLVARYRERLFQERDRYQAITQAVGKASGAILMSGLTVMLALLSLLFATYGSDHRFAIPFFVAIFVMAIVGLTFIPALLAVFGRVAFFPFIPRVLTEESQLSKRQARKLAKQNDPNRFSFGRFVAKNPIAIASSAIVILAILGSFATQIHFTYNLLSSFPKTMPSREGFTLLADHFSPGTLAPVNVITKGGTEATMTSTLSKLPFVQSVSSPTISKKDSSLLSYSVTLKEDPYSLVAISDIPKIRSALTALPAGSAPSQVYLGGETSTQYDTKVLTESDTRIVIPIVIAIIAILLLLYLRSIVAMIYLIATVLLSYFSSLGLGWIVLHNFMGVTAIAGAIPLYAFVFLVALGEDYNIFMISRIWQESRTNTLAKAVEIGVNKTGSVITSAGLILAGTFAVLASLPIQILVQFGIVTAIGVLLDTFIVRPFLVPSLTIILGKLAFWPSKRQITVK